MARVIAMTAVLAIFFLGVKVGRDTALDCASFPGMQTAFSEDVVVVQAPSEPSLGSPNSLSASAFPGCSWSFSHYEPSPMESEWVARMKDNPLGKNFCHKGGLQFTLPHSDSVFRVMLLTTLLGLRMPHNSSDYALLSRMHYSLNCPGNSSAPVRHGEQLIEPLFGILRDPCDHYCSFVYEDRRVFCGGASQPHPFLASIRGQSKRHILTLADAPFKTSAGDKWQIGMVAPWHCRSIEPCKRANGLFIDAGASVFGFAAMDSQGWLFNMFHRRNVAMRDFYTFEFQHHSAKAALDAIPDEIFPAYHWINVGVEQNAASKYNPWTILMRQRRRGNSDVAIIKLDIDTPNIERPLVEQLGRFNQSVYVVDEFFYEHHVNSDHMNGFWDSWKETQTLSDSYAMFGGLRRLGIRSHSWP